MNIHEHYDRLTTNEKAFLDDAFSYLFRLAKHYEVPVAGDDRAERAVDAAAKLIIESRKPGTIALPWSGRRRDGANRRGTV